MPFSSKIEQTASQRSYGYFLSQFAYFDQKSSYFTLINYFVRILVYLLTGQYFLGISGKDSSQSAAE